MPIHMGVKPDNSADDVFLDQHWGECINCGCIQLMNLVFPDILYSVSHDPGSQGKLWKQHHEEFAEFILDGKPDAIFEIGGSSGNLASIIFNHIYDMPYSILDPGNFALDKRISFHNMLFENYKGVLDGCVVHSHTIEHVLDPKKFLQKIYELMPDGGEMYMSFPDMEQGLLSSGTNTLCFEHTYFLNIDQFKHLLEKIGFEIGKQYNFNSHSYFLQVIKNENNLMQPRELKAGFNQLDMFNNMWNRTQYFVDGVLEKLDDTPTYIFGAHIFSQALIALGLKHHSISGILDESPSKIGKVLYGSNLEVYAPSRISGDQPLSIILRAGVYQNEIKSRLLSLNPKIKILE